MSSLRKPEFGFSFTCSQPLRFSSLQGLSVFALFQEASERLGHWPSGLVWPSLFLLWSCCGSKTPLSSQRSPRLRLGWAGLITPELEVPPWNKDGVWGPPLIQPHNPSASVQAHFVPFGQVYSQGRKSKLTLNLQSEYFHEEWDVDEQFLHCSLYNRGFCWNRAGVAQLPFFIYPDGELALFDVSFPPQGCAALRM